MNSLICHLYIAYITMELFSRSFPMLGDQHSKLGIHGNHQFEGWLTLLQNHCPILRTLALLISLHSIRFLLLELILNRFLNHQTLLLIKFDSIAQLTVYFHYLNLELHILLIQSRLIRGDKQLQYFSFYYFIIINMHSKYFINF